MFSPLTRLFVLVCLSAAAIILAFAGKMWLLILASILSLYLLWDYIQRGTVPLALKKLANGEIQQAKKLVDTIRNPKRLSKKYYAYYKLILGMYERENDNYKNAKALLRTAMKVGIPSENFRAMNYLALADIAIIQKDKNLAREYVLKMKGFKVQKSLMDSIRKMQNYLQI